VLRSERRPAQAKTDVALPFPADEQAAALEQEIPTNEALPVLPIQPEQFAEDAHEEELPPVPVARRDVSNVPVMHDGTSTQPVNEIRVHLNGQFYELANSLRDLRQQASEMEQRLNSLTNMIDTIERKQDGDRV